MDALIKTLIDYPMLTLFVVIGIGYLLGALRIFGFSFGVAGVLFVGLAVGSLSPLVALPELVSSLGLTIFVYTIGIQSGPAFFEGFRKQGARDSLVAGAVLAFGALLAAALSYVIPLSPPRTAGLYCGSLTNTPALAATRERIRDNARQESLPAEKVRAISDEPTVAYSVAYPFGVIGVLLCFQFARRYWGVRIEPPPEPPEITARDFLVKNPGVINRTVAEVMRLHKEPGFVITRIQQGGTTTLAKSDTVLGKDNIVVCVGDEFALERAQQIFGEPSMTRIELDRSELDYRRVFVSSKEVVGKRIKDLDLQNRLEATITRLRRGDADVVPTPETRLEFGDRVRVLTHRDNFARVSKFFGDSIRGTAETDFGSVAVGMVLGVMAGMIPIPIPGSGTIRLGLAGGPLLVALVLGKLERSGQFNWAIPISANLTLRQIGLLLFLAGVGTRAGSSFADTVANGGLGMLLGGAILTVSVTLTTLFVGHRFLKISFDALMGMMSGIQTQPACLAFACNVARSESPNVAYARVYPAATIAKIVLAQLLLTIPKS